MATAPQENPDIRQTALPSGPKRSGRYFGKTTAAIVCGMILLFGARVWKAVFHYRAETCIRNHDIDSGLLYLSWADKLGDRAPKTSLLKARSARRKGQPELFQQYLQEAEQRGATAVQLQRETILFAAQSGQIQLSAPHLSALLTDTSGDNKDVCLAYITGYLRNQRNSDALILLDAWLTDSPDDYLPWLIRGKVRRHRRDNGGAESDLQEAIRLSPENTEALVELGELLLDANRVAESRVAFENAPVESLYRARRAVGLAKCLKSLGQFEDALKLLTFEAKQSPDDAHIWMELGRTQFENSLLSEARQSLEMSLKCSPWNDEAMYILAQCLNQLQQTEEAQNMMAKVKEYRKGLDELQSLKDQLRTDPLNTAALVQSGEILLKYSNPDEAAVTLQAALDIEPQNKQAHQLLAEYFELPNVQNEKRAAWHRQQAMNQANSQTQQ